jgi:hypothetical protein
MDADRGVAQDGVNPLAHGRPPEAVEHLKDGSAQPGHRLLARLKVV